MHRTRHAPGEVLQRHRHDQGFAAIVLQGAYVEAGDSGRYSLVAGDVIFHRPFESHLDRFGAAFTEVAVLPLTASAPPWLLGSVDDPDAIVRAAERDPGEAAAILLATAAPRTQGVRDWPDLLSSDLLASPDLILEHWAHRHGLHPGSVSRGFAQQFGLTPASFRLLVRTHRAVELIRCTVEPLSQVAALCGFSDQAHMNRAVKRATGQAPGRLRRQLEVA